MSINLNFANLEPHVQDKFFAVAAKDPDGSTAVEWFEHLVPDSLQDSSHETEVFMDGGTVTQEVYVYDQGRASGHYETVEHNIGDRDISRIEAGVNGGEYTQDNTIMEDSSTNRSRGGEDMTSTEYEAAEVSEAVDTSLIDGSASTEFFEATDASADLVTTAGESLSELIAPVIGSIIVGKAVADQFEKPVDKIGWGSLAGGFGALLCTTPPGQFALGCYGIYSVGKLALKATKYAIDNV